MKKNIISKLVIILFFFILIFFPATSYAMGCYCSNPDKTGEGGSVNTLVTCPDDLCKEGECKYLICEPQTVTPASKAEAAKQREIEWAKYTPVLNIKFGGTEIKFDPVSCEAGSECSINWIGQYINVLYRYIIGIAAILAAVMILVGGFIWLSSAGNPSRITQAKEFIFGALTGLLLALFSYLILYTLNPNLVNLSPIKIYVIDPTEIGDSTPGAVEETKKSFAKGGGSDTSSWDENTKSGVKTIGDLDGLSNGATRPGHSPSASKAADFMIDGLPLGGNINDFPDLLTKGDAAAKYIMDHAAELNVSYVIWNQRIWNAARDPIADPSQWREMQGRGGNTANHLDHIHTSFN